jgi:hypothetical protein
MALLPDSCFDLRQSAIGGSMQVEDVLGGIEGSKLPLGIFVHLEDDLCVSARVKIQRNIFQNTTSSQVNE